MFPTLLFRLYAAGLFLGGIYSVPPFRTKRNPILAGLTIATVRGFLLNFGVYYAVKDAIGVPFNWSPKVSFVARFMTIFASVIAITKDLPDIEGDKVRCINLSRSYLLRKLNVIFTGISNRNLCYKNRREAHRAGVRCVSPRKLYSRYCYRDFGRSQCFQYCSNGWWAPLARSRPHFTLSISRCRINDICEKILQADLGFILFGIWPVYAYLAKLPRLVSAKHGQGVTAMSSDVLQSELPRSQ